MGEDSIKFETVQQLGSLSYKLLSPNDTRTVINATAINTKKEDSKHYISSGIIEQEELIKSALISNNAQDITPGTTSTGLKTNELININIGFIKNTKKGKLIVI